uniref:uncharacterized protein LOC122601927 n=1 Tax=Erigeron canadensis TaxID=72917 RepID=UPI001CB95C09|nr:uncharacterized protein LOC122601927 [Erigeron canadensis]
MESWIPLVNIFMNSPSPETTPAALRFLLQSPNISTSSFLSLLIKPTNSSRFIWLQTLPNVVQARILSFLVYHHDKFNKQDLSKLATHLLSDDNNNKVKIDFWVKKAARQLFDLVSDSNYKWVSCFNLDSQEDNVDNGKFDEDIIGGVLPDWLKNAAASNENDSVFPWTPVSVDDVLNTRMPDVLFEEDDDGGDDDDELMVEVEDGEEDGNRELAGVDVEMVHLDRETEEKAEFLKMKILNLGSNLKAAELVDDIRKLCVEEKGNSLKVLGLIEIWNADDEIVPIMLSGLSDGNEEDFVLASDVVCSVVLPKFLNLEKSASRVLVSATIDYCRVHHKAAVYALLFPLILHKDGINSSICDVITRIVKECLHPAHVSAFCQKLLCEEKVYGKGYICLPCHQHLVSKELVWTESLFNMFQNILNHNVHLTQDSVDRLVFHIQESATMFSKSLKFANFLLCFITKCAPLLKIHKVELSEAVGNTTSFLTKSILSKLASI